MYYSFLQTFFRFWLSWLSLQAPAQLRLTLTGMVALVMEASAAVALVMEASAVVVLKATSGAITMASDPPLKKRPQMKPIPLNNQGLMLFLQRMKIPRGKRRII